MILKLLTVLFALLATWACGNGITDTEAREKEKEKQKSSTVSSDAPTSSATATQTTSAQGQRNPASTGPEAADKQGGYLTGYVVSAFDMRVNGQNYADSEVFYSQQMDDLLVQVQDAGYDGYTMAFDGQLGLDDLKFGMDVYVAARGKTGFAGDTTVNESGRFMMGIPNGSGDETFQIRTNKRVSVILTSPDRQTVVRWCYNFSSVNTEGRLHEPVLISEFTTTLTKYQCANSSGGMQIPGNPTSTKARP